MPIHTWAPFERLLSEDLNTYVGEQVPAIFTDAAARDIAIPAPILGQPAYLTGLRALTRWNGSVWKIEAIAGGVVSMLTETAAQTAIGNGVLAQVGLTIVSEDSHGFALGSSALTVPVGMGGLYQLNGNVVWNSPGGTATNYRIVMIRKGATTILQASGPAVPNAYFIQEVRGIKRLAAGDVITLYCQHNQGSALAIVNNAGEFGPLLQLMRVGD